MSQHNFGGFFHALSEGIFRCKEKQDLGRREL